MNLPKPGPVAKAAAASAQLNVGVREEGGNNRGKWIKMYLAIVSIFEPAAWCCAFVVFRVVRASAALNIAVPDWFPKTGYCPTLVNAAKKHGLWIDVADAKRGENPPQRGDLACFWFASKNRIAHIGIVTMAGHPWGVFTVEGNTGPDAPGGPNRDGDGVYEKKRDWSELGVNGGFIRLPF